MAGADSCSDESLADLPTLEHHSVLKDLQNYLRFCVILYLFLELFTIKILRPPFFSDTSVVQ